ncbi:hypothetical protein NW762_010280 [Fusarium torreyae]|uniref:F-box domain-containing protein n=1 Tax=Fusarium torreyae TaxID=1237075 RepID=A0A9W8RUL1_9HYPO|nr:hypothetical protein NW762_010280 [Fusarium torreyae]
MNNILSRLPPELLAPILSELTVDDKKHISLTDSTMRTIMAPYLYTTIVIDCPVPESSSLSNVTQKYGLFVKSLYLRIHIYPNNKEPDREEIYGDSDEDDGDEKSVSEDEANHMIQKGQQEEYQGDEEAKDDTGLPSGDFDYETFWENPPASVWARKAADAPVVRDIIQSKGLPNCRTLIITVDPNKTHKLYNERYWDEYSEDKYHFCRSSEVWEKVQRLEKVYAWRATMRDMWYDIATLSKAERLVIHDFMPKRVTTWQKSEWASFLGGLRDLTLFMYGKYNETSWPASVYYGFTDFLQNLSTDMWQHLSKLERLKIVAHEKGFIDHRSMDFPLGSMPSLRTIYLENVTATDVLTEYLRGGCPHLEEIHLKDCVAGGWTLKTATTWGELWQAARETGERPIRIIWEESYAPHQEGDEDPDEDLRGSWAYAYEKLKATEPFRVWPYAKLRGHGMEMNRGIVEYLKESDDSREYIKLLEEMEWRRSKISLGTNQLPN